MPALATSLTNWLTKIEAGHPVDIDMGLERVSEVAKRLDIHFSDATVITVAGTNGKGTTCRLIEQSCLHAGLSVAVYSSPHILQFNERIRINGVDAVDDDICDAFEQIEDAKAEISLTYFEYATLAALYLFVKAKTDVVILEVGLGGRLDATNIIDADINVLTSIGLDHQDYLGNTLDDIAAEKAGIIKPNKNTVIGFDQKYEKAETWLAQQNNTVLRRGRDFDLLASQASSVQAQGSMQAQGSGQALAQTNAPAPEQKQKADASGTNEILSEGFIRLGETRQLYQWRKCAIPNQNVMTALATLWSLHAHLKTFSDSAWAKAKALEGMLASSKEMQRVIESTSLAGRAQVIGHSPTILLDVAHNEASAELLLDKIRTFETNECHIVVGMLKDKNIEATLNALSSLSAHWYCASLPGKRGESYERLVNAVPQANALSISGYVDIASALAKAINKASNTDMIVVFGSFVTAAQTMHYIDEKKT